MAFIPVSFSPLGSSKRKLLHVIPFGSLSGLPQVSFRSLNIEHVFPVELMRKESLRPTQIGASASRALAAGGAASDELMLSLLRRWYWSRKVDTGFCIHGFPANRLQANVLDEWLEVRDETLDACVISEITADHEVARHYKLLGVPMVLESELTS